MENKIISKSWMIRHIIISFFISVLAMVFFANESRYNSYEEEGIIGFVCTSAIYWVLVLIYVAIIKAYRGKIYNKGWVRLHIIMSFVGGIIICLLLSILRWDFDKEGIWLICLGWPCFYWLWILINSGVIFFNKNIVSKMWLKRHFYIALFISCLQMIYRITQKYSYTNSEGEYISYREWNQEYEIAFFGGSSFLIYYFLLFSTIWIMSGFKESKSLIE